MVAEQGEQMHEVLIGGDLLSPRWTALAESLLPAALNDLARRGLAPQHSEVSLTLVDDDQIQRLNREYRGKDEATDVLSFSLIEGEGLDLRQVPNARAIPLGDIVISVPHVLGQAEEYGHSAEREFGYLLVHGLLHLLGYDHMDPEGARRMREAEEEALAAAGLSRETASTDDVGQNV